MDFIRRSQVPALASKYKMIGFGAGETGEKTDRLFDGIFDFFVDNHRAKFGDSFTGRLTVKHPSELGKEDPEKCLIVICSEHLESIQEQLKQEFPNFRAFISPLLKDNEFISKLKNASQRILVSSYGACGGLYLVNCQNRNVELLCEGSFRGMEWLNSQIIVTNEHGDLFRIESIEPFKMEKIYESPQIRQCHGLQIDLKRNQIYRADAAFDQISIFDLESLQIKDQISLSSEFYNNSPQDFHHVNDLYLEGDTLYASLISQSGKWKEGSMDGCLMQINLETKEQTILFDSLVYPHSIVKMNDQFYVLEALKGEVRCLESDLRLQFPGFLRGMFWNEKLCYVGQSRSRHLAKSREFQANLSMDNGIHIILLDQQLSRFVPLPDDCDVYTLLDLEEKEL